MDFRFVFFLQGSRAALMRLLVGSAALVAAGFAPARAVEAVLYRFKSGSDGHRPLAGLIFDSKGALYGTTEATGVPPFNGTVFKLTPPAPGHTQWTETVLTNFTAPGAGFTPVAGLIFDSKGALYGTTSEGGPVNLGAVFKLTPPAPGHTQWTETVLYGFNARGDGFGPAAGLIFDDKGALYGTTSKGGAPSQNGAVFKLTPPAPGHTKWTETVLYSFKGGSDGADPLAGLILDSKGALYGTTFTGGTANSTCFGFPGCGTVFKLTPPAPGHTQWTETVLYRFKGVPDGNFPVAGLIFDSKGALYGTTEAGGKHSPTSFNHGTVFKLTPPAPGHTQWTETVLYSFGAGTDGAFPVAGLIFDSKGALYGTTVFGGSCPSRRCSGTVLKLTPPAPGQTRWTETLLHSFDTTTSDGNDPNAGVIFDSKGALYGTTAFGGGPAANGTVFKVQ